MSKKAEKPAKGARTSAPPPAPRSIPDHWPRETTSTVPLAEVVPSPLNPRKTFPKESLAELAKSIAEHGLLQPLLVRPVGDRVAHDGEAWLHVDKMELVDGERRYRAALSIGIKEVPCIIRPLTDADVLAIMLVANDQREDVRPSEQAAAYKALADEIGVEGTAKQSGKSLSSVREIIRLGSLPKWCLAAVDDGTLSRSAAAVVARVPGAEARQFAAAEALCGWLPAQDMRPKLEKLEAHVAKTLKDETRGHHGEPMTAREVKQMVQRIYSRELKGAPFDRKSLTLVEAAGSCDACPKRAGNDPDLVADGVREDICTDTDCFASKLAAWKSTAITDAVAKGFRPMPEDFEWPQYGGMPSGWIDLTEKIEKHSYSGLAGELKDAGHAGKTISGLLGKEFDAVYVTIHNDKLVKLAKNADVRKALIAAGKLKKAAKGSKGAGGSKASREPSDWLVEKKIGLLIARKLRQKIATDSNLKAGLLLAAKGHARMTYGDQDGGDYWEDLDPAGMIPTIDNTLQMLQPADVLGWLVGSLAVEVWSAFDYEVKQFRQQIQDFAGIDEAELKKLRTEAIAAIKADAKKGAAAA